MTKLTPLQTEDGSHTFHNEELGESYHTKSGAVTEALHKHVIPSAILKEIKSTNEVFIADVCFGLGYNSLVALHEIYKVNPTCVVHLYAFENDPVILEKIASLEFPNIYEHEAAFIKQFAKDGLLQNATLNATLLVGDAQVMLPSLPDDKLDVVFYDPFSPKKQPELWTKELFTVVFAKMKRGATLTTYSCARVVRENLNAAGFAVTDGPCVGRRAPSTIAKKP